MAYVVLARPKTHSNQAKSSQQLSNIHLSRLVAFGMSVCTSGAQLGQPLIHNKYSRAYMRVRVFSYNSIITTNSPSVMFCSEKFVNLLPTFLYNIYSKQETMYI